MADGATTPREHELEAAVLRYLTAERELAAVAAGARLDLAALARLAAAYRAHGRRALSEP